MLLVMETNLVEIWLRKDPTRWIAGALSGIFAGLVAMAFAMFLAALSGYEIWFPIKFSALPLLGNEALEVGLHISSIATGLIFHEFLCAVIGIVYAHFTGTNQSGPLLGVGISFGAFSWIFINNLFWPSFRAVLIAEVSQGAAFFVCVIFGITLSSVSFFDRMLRKN